MSLRTSVSHHVRYLQDSYHRLSQEDPLHIYNEFSKIIDPVIIELQGGSLANIDKIFAFIAFDKKFHQSGYKKEKIYKYLKRIPLTDEQEAVLIDILQGQTNITKREQHQLNNLLEKLRKE